MSAPGNELHNVLGPAHCETSAVPVVKPAFLKTLGAQRGQGEVTHVYGRQ